MSQKINLTTLIEKLEPTMLAEPIHNGFGGYYVLDESFGVFSWEEACFLADQLRKGFVLSLVHKSLQ